MLKFKEIMATLFAVLGIILIVGTVGAVETDQYILALTLFVICLLYTSDAADEP